MIRVALSGCGAAARIYHRPALKALESRDLIRVVGGFDPNADAAEEFCAHFTEATKSDRFSELVGRKPDLLVIASPPDHHGAQTIEAVRAGIAVLCEKPFAPSLAEAESMVAEARNAGSLLAVGMVRRQFGAARMIRALLKNAAIGTLREVEIFEGGLFRWPVHSASYFMRSRGGVGVLEDIGTHVLDLVTWWLGDPDDLAYYDDAMGGLAANCLIEMTFGGCPVRIRISRDWHRPNRYQLRGESGRITWTDVDPAELELVVGDLPPTKVGPMAAAGSFEDAFERQLLAMIDALGGRASETITGAEALGTVRLIERCHAVRRELEMPWLR